MEEIILKKFTNRTLTLILNEYAYLVKTRILFVVLFCIFGFLSLYTVLNMNVVQQNYTQYMQSREHIQQLHGNVDEELKKPETTSMKVLDDGITIRLSNNPIKRTYNNLLLSIKFFTPEYLGQGVLEFLTAFLGPLIWGITSVFFNNYDYKYKTIKLKAIENKWYKTIIYRQLVLICLITITTIMVYLIFSIVGNITYKIALQNITNINIESIARITSKTSIFTKIITSIFIQSFYALIASLLIIIFKKSIYPTIVFLVYFFVIPNLGILDIKNLSLNIISKAFDFYGSARLGVFKDFNIYYAILILTSIYIGFFILLGVIANKQSKYI